MGIMGAIGAGIAEAGGAAAQIGLTQIKAAIEADRDARLSEMQMQRDEIVRARNKSDAAEERTRQDTEAQAMADKRGGGLMASARDQYRKSGMSEEDIAAGLGAVDEAEAAGSYKQEPTLRDRMLARGDVAGAATDERAERTAAAAAAERATDNTRADRALALQEKTAAATIANAARAATKDMAADADKKKLRAEYEAYGALLVQDAAKPGSQRDAIARSATRIASLGGNPQVLTDLLLGAKEKVEVTSKKDAMGTDETSTKKIVQGERAGGIMGAPARPAGANTRFILKDGKLVPASAK